VTYLLRLSEPGRDAQRRKERQALVECLGLSHPDAGFADWPGRIVLETSADVQEELAQLHGVVSFSRCQPCALGELESYVVALARANAHGRRSFRVRVRRVGVHPFTSAEKAAELGHAVRLALPGARVDLAHPDVELGVEIRGDRCYVFDAVYPGLDRRARPTPEPPAERRFLVDQMLGRLRAWLRVLGIDAAGTHDQSDGQVLARAVAEERIVLTRDRALARTPGVLVHYVEATRTVDQVREVVAAFALEIRRSHLLSRCTFCNVPVAPIALDDVRGQVPLVARRLYLQFFRCPACARVYWPGDQYQRILAAVGDLVRD
jgi:uncharacterized protein with PIN domain/tRNA(Ser,Leu) C12 N-acetylase TAN1